MRDRLSHRGPDGAGLWKGAVEGGGNHIILAHRRLAVVDLSEAAAQPMVTPSGSRVLIYNGELYNDAELRRELSRLGVRFRTSCDAETVLMALDTWGHEALSRFRGMFALASFETRTRELLLARDPLGIKPLYFRIDAGGGGDHPEVIFASEPAAILAHPDIPVRPDLATISWYLTSLRTTLGHRTLFDGIRTLRPGEAMSIDLSREARWHTGGGGGAGGGAGHGLKIWSHWRPPSISASIEMQEAAPHLRELIGESVRGHLRADVPVAVLLSGGLDSTIMTLETLRARRELGGHAPAFTRTYVAGLIDDAAQSTGTSDLHHARRLAAELGTTHREVTLGRDEFLDHWQEMVSSLGVPLGTPNEVAIRLLGRAIREDGCVVALSGEGADELFGGYGQSLDDAFALASRGGGLPLDGASCLGSCAWINGAAKNLILQPDIWRWLERDAAINAELTDDARSEHHGAGAAADPLAGFLRTQRRINLAGLLSRLDSSLMLESIEGRTPLADRVIADYAESLPTPLKYLPPGSTTSDEEPRTKRVLRRAFADVLPPDIYQRPKASFALPFEGWIAERAGTLRESALAREIFSPAGAELIENDPRRQWKLAWPMLNIAEWGKRWWS